MIRDELGGGVDRVRWGRQSGDEVKAEAYAREVLSTPDLPGKSGDGVFHANDVLGMLALKRDDIAGAKRYMIESAKAPGLTHGGPSFRLVEALLSRGERDAVLEYLDLCKGFLRHQDLIEAWRGSIRSGGHAAVPRPGRREPEGCAALIEWIETQLRRRATRRAARISAARRRPTLTTR